MPDDGQPSELEIAKIFRKLASKTLDAYSFTNHEQPYSRGSADLERAESFLNQAEKLLGGIQPGSLSDTKIPIDYQGDNAYQPPPYTTEKSQYQNEIRRLEELRTTLQKYRDTNDKTKATDERRFENLKKYIDERSNDKAIQQEVHPFAISQSSNGNGNGHVNEYSTELTENGMWERY